MTTHDEMRALVAAFAAGELIDRLPAERHLRECDECRLWLQTYRAFSEMLDGHPTSEALAGFATQADRVEKDREHEIERHLENCEACRHEVELSRAAVAYASQEGEPLRRRFSVRSRLAMAAGLFAAVVGLGLVLGPRQAAESGRVEISELAIAGSRTIEAPDVLVAGESALLDGANVTLSARHVVALGEGFSVASKAALVIETQYRDDGQ